MSETPKALKLDKSKWGDGPWQTEPDRIEWEQHGMPCLMLRNRMGAWCGYVAVNPGHRFYGVGYSSCTKKPQCKKSKRDHYCDHTPGNLLNVHGGITYGNTCKDHICHVPKPGQPDNVFWLGFDCAHGGDVIPSMNELIPKGITCMTMRDPFGGTYKDVPYVKREVNRLAKQLLVYAK